MKTQKGKPSPHETLLAETPLSPHLAFVVQFRTSRGGIPTSYSGRVEHMTSGRVTHFHSRTELWTFLTQVVVEEEPRSKEPENLSHFVTSKKDMA